LIRRRPHVRQRPSLEGERLHPITLNATAIFVLTQAVGQRCKVPRRRGKVINIASIQGLIGACPEGMPSLAYNASKAAVVT
jgi:NAD(P)-dependent dehydrogenase (short-subunit alcohol dehydrogenase family)